MSKPDTTIFLLGATGYIGGTVLSHLLTHPNATKYQITVLVRSEEKAIKLESFGVKAVVGSTSEREKLAGLVEQAHVVFSCADSDDLGAVKTILSGMHKRHATLGDVPILIHTSGTGVLVENAGGMHTTDVTYDDTDVKQIESLPSTQIHREVDLTIVEADKQGYLRSYIILPSMIYGIASNPLVDAGIQKHNSFGICMLAQIALTRGQAGVVGKGISTWNDVHIEDVANLYILIFDGAMTNPEKIGHGREGLYIGENGEHSWYAVSQAISTALSEVGHVQGEREPTPFTAEELMKYFGSEFMRNLFGSNSRGRGSRGRSIGWKPKYTTADMLATVKPEVEVLIQKQSKK